MLWQLQKDPIKNRIDAINYENIILQAAADAPFFRRHRGGPQFISGYQRLVFWVQPQFSFFVAQKKKKKNGAAGSARNLIPL